MSLFFWLKSWVATLDVLTDRKLMADLEQADEESDPPLPARKSAARSGAEEEKEA